MTARNQSDNGGRLGIPLHDGRLPVPIHGIHSRQPVSGWAAKKLMQNKEHNAALEIRRAQQDPDHPLHAFLAHADTPGMSKIDVLALAHQAHAAAAQPIITPPGPTTFDEWLASLDDTTQLYFLGDDRFAEYQAGTLSFEPFAWMLEDGSKSGVLKLDHPSEGFTESMKREAAAWHANGRQRTATGAFFIPGPDAKLDRTDVSPNAGETLSEQTDHAAKWPQSSETPPTDPIPSPEQAAANAGNSIAPKPTPDLPPGHPDYVGPIEEPTIGEKVLAFLRDQAKPEQPKIIVHPGSLVNFSPEEQEQIRNHPDVIIDGTIEPLTFGTITPEGDHKTLPTGDASATATTNTKSLDDVVLDLKKEGTTDAPGTSQEKPAAPGTTTIPDPIPDPPKPVTKTARKTAKKAGKTATTDNPPPDANLQ